jgi:hypothetical protein
VKWYADNSELHGIKNAEIPDILLFGGLVVSPADEHHIRTKVEAIKQRHTGYSRSPFKWNQKDLKELYKSQGKTEIYESLMRTSKEWRREVFSCLAETNCAILISCIESYSADRKVLKEKKEELSRFIFTNGLMRFGLHVRDAKPSSAQVVLDWPDKGNPKPFDSEYAWAFSRGRTADGSVTYQCGKLCDLAFADSVLFTSMHHSTLLQVADLVVGATREFLECCLEKKKSGQGIDCLRLAKGKFRGAPDNIVGRGIVVPSRNGDLLSRARKGVREILNAI